MEPAGEMWSVVTEIAEDAQRRAPFTSFAVPAPMPKLLPKNGGSAI